MFQKRFSGFIVIFLFLVLVIPLISQSQSSVKSINLETPSLIVYNGTIITMDDSSPEAEAFAVQGDKFLAVGSDSSILSLAGPDTLVIDLAGKTVLPGFIDSHGHWLGDLELGGFTSHTEAIKTVISNGWTSISELFVNEDRINDLRSLDSSNNLRLRVNAYLPLSWQYERFGTWYQSYSPHHEYSPHLRISGVKIFADRWIGNRTELYFNESELFNLVSEADNLGYQVAIHSVSQNATDIVLNVFDSILSGDSNFQRRFRIEHLVELRDDQILRIKDLGIIASFQFDWFNSDSAWDLDSIGLFSSEDIALLARWRDLLDSGATAIGSTDYPYSNGPTSSSLDAIYQVVTRIGFSGSTPFPWMLNQTITVEQALRLLTIDAAYGTFQEHLKGSIEDSKLADFLILSDNPLTTPLSSFSDIDILSTVISGISEYCAPGSETLCSPTPFSSHTSTSLSSSSTSTTSISTSSMSFEFIFFAVFIIAVVNRLKK